MELNSLLAVWPKERFLGSHAMDQLKPEDKSVEPITIPECASSASFPSPSPSSAALDESYEHKTIFAATNEDVKPVNVKEVSKEYQAHFNRSVPRTREQEAHVMILYTGGTIGMKISPEDNTYVPEPHFLPRHIQEMPHMNDTHYVRQFYPNMQIPPGALPTIRKYDRRVLYWLFEYTPLLDSSDMTFDDWSRIAKDIYRVYERYDGFVVLHGTDTMAFTASALSFMFENLGKPIVVTGSQIPICEVRSDGRENFIGACIVAALFDIPEVLIYFNNKVFRGNRCIKMDNSGLDAFACPNMDPLAELGIDIKVDHEAVFRSTVPAKMNLRTHLSRNVGILRLFPSITNDCVKAFLKEPIQGVVIQTFGSGNFSANRNDVIDLFKQACDRGLLIVNSSQCPRGAVKAAYHTGQVLADAGVIAGSDMTAEAALTKLAYVLGRSDWDAPTKKEMLQRNLRGELTVFQSDNRCRQPSADLGFLKSFGEFLHVSSNQEMDLLKMALVPPLLCYAASKGDLPLLNKVHYATGVSLGCVDYDNRTALHVAASAGQLDMVKHLLAQGANIHTRDSRQSNPLQCAVDAGRLDVVKELRAAGAHLTKPEVYVGMKLCLAADQRNIEQLRCWHSAGIKMTQADYDGRTPLHVAIDNDFPDVVEFLLRHKADPIQADQFGRNAFDEAKRVGRPKDSEIWRLLVAYNSFI